VIEQEKPQFHDWRRTNDAVMIPSPHFIKQLRALDPKLYVQWDWGSSRWEIWRKPEGKTPFMVMRVQNQDKSYRELGADILLKLQAGDPHRFTEKEFISYFEAMDDAIRASKARDMARRIGAISKEIAWYLHGNPTRVQVPKQFANEKVPILKGPDPLIKIGGVLHA